MEEEIVWQTYSKTWLKIEKGRCTFSIDKNTLYWIEDVALIILEDILEERCYRKCSNIGVGVVDFTNGAIHSIFSYSNKSLHFFLLVLFLNYLQFSATEIEILSKCLPSISSILKEISLKSFYKMASINLIYYPCLWLLKMYRTFLIINIFL